MTALKQIRQSLGLSQMDMAKKVGVSLMTIQLWERGISNPNEKNKEALKTVLEELEKERKTCPFEFLGYRFGIDGGEYDECNECLRWEDCWEAEEGRGT